MKRRSPLFWLLLTAFGAASLWWTVHVPYEPARLYRAVPVQATLLSAHYNVAGRWDALATNPLILSVAQALGVNTDAWDQLSRDEGFRSMLEMLASDELLVAYVPEMRTSGEPAWVFASWVGGDSQRLRWMLNSFKMPELRRAASRNGWPVWVWTPRRMSTGARVTFAVVEGMVVGCVAADTSGIDEVLGCYDRHMASIADRPERLLPGHTEHLDRGWVSIAGWGHHEPEPLSYALTLSASGGVEGTVTAPFTPAITGSVSSPQATADTAGLLGDLPIACAVMDRSLSRVWLEQFFTNALAREVGGLLQGETAGTVTLGLLGGPYSGHFMAVRLPTLVAGLSMNDPDRALTGMNSVLDRLNAATQWGLVPQLEIVGTQRVFAVEGTGHNAYASLETKERLAYTALGGSLVFGSNLETLSRLLKERDESGPRAGSRLAGGIQRMRERQALAYLWFDLKDGGRVLRLAITAWSLKLLVENPARTQSQRDRLNVAKAWIDALEPFGQLQVWARPRGEGTEFDFKMGTD